MEYINKDQLLKIADSMSKSEYGEYLNRLLK
jgi:hypothetical protein